MRHEWFVYEGDGGPAGAYEVWMCSVCGACESCWNGHTGGNGFCPDPAFPPDHTKYIKPRPFYPNGSGLKLTMDCEESQKLIQKAITDRFRADLKWPLSEAVKKAMGWTNEEN